MRPTLKPNIELNCNRNAWKGPVAVTICPIISYNIVMLFKWLHPYVKLQVRLRTTNWTLHYSLLSNKTHSMFWFIIIVTFFPNSPHNNPKRLKRSQTPNVFAPTNTQRKRGGHPCRDIVLHYNLFPRYWLTDCATLYRKSRKNPHRKTKRRRGRLS